MPVKSETLPRLWRKVALGSSDACWLWLGGTDQCGYGSIGVSQTGTTDRVHRVVYRREIGDIPEGMTIDHLCRNRACVNPRHMEVVSAAENIRRRNGWLNGKCGKGHVLADVGRYEHKGNGKQRCRPCHLNRVRQDGLRKRAGL